MRYELIGIIGPTAVGKTKLAVAWAAEKGGEIISADSRQVYRGMDLGSGKDLEEYVYQGEKIPHHLIDILDAGEAYDLFRFQADFFQAFRSIRKREKQAVLCGGTGMYIQAALNKEQLIQVAANEVLRQKLANYTQSELNDYLMQVKSNLHNRTDLEDRERTIRAIEIALYEKAHPEQVKPSPIKSYLLFGIQLPREKLRERIKIRLQDRLENGMIEEVKQLLEQGISHKQLQYYGLEYKYLSLYVQGKLNYDEMFAQLLQAIRRFAKKQMTWYRRMERQGFQIHWMDAEVPLEEKVKFIESKCRQ